MATTQLSTLPADVQHSIYVAYLSLSRSQKSKAFVGATYRAEEVKTERGTYIAFGQVDHTSDKYESAARLLDVPSGPSCVRVVLSRDDLRSYKA